MFYGWSEAIDLGVKGLVFILLYYIAALFIFNRKNDKVLISGILIIIYVYTIMLYSLNDTSYLWDYSSIYRVGFGLLNGLLFIPFLVFCFAVDLVSFLVRKYIKRKEKVINEEEKKKNSEEILNEEKSDVDKKNLKKTKKWFNKSVIVTVLVVLSIVFQFIFMAILDWWGTSGKYQAKVNEAIKYEKAYDFKSEIEKLKEEKYSDEVRERVRYLYDEKLEELFNEGKYEECIELTSLLSENFGYDYDYDFCHSVKPGWGNPSRKSFVKLYEEASNSNDKERMLKIKKRMIKNDSESYWENYYNVSFDNLTKYDYMKYAEVGDIVTLGKYYVRALSDTKNKEDVSWIVYKIDDDKMYLMASYALEDYVLKVDDKNYKNSKLREYLNDEFFHEIFREHEIELIERDENSDYISIPDRKVIDLIKENRNNSNSSLRSEYLNELSQGLSILLRDSNYIDNQYVIWACDNDETIHSFDEYFIGEKINFEYDVLILPTIIINKKKIDDYIVKDEKFKNEKVKYVSQKLKQQIVDKKTIKEYSANETVGNFDTVLFGKKSGKRFYKKGITVPYGIKSLEEVEEFKANEKKKRKKEAQEYKAKTFANDEYFEWIILEKDENKALLLSKDIISVSKYQEYSIDSDYEQKKITWENSEVRRELNSWFINKLFGEYEKDIIIDTPIKESKNPRFGTINESDTKDKIFILSVEDCLKYFTDVDYELNDNNIEIKKLIASFDKETKKYFLELFYEYEREKYDTETARYWLRDLGEQFWNACFVDSNGAINTRGEYVANGKMGYRPAMWVKLK